MLALKPLAPFGDVAPPAASLAGSSEMGAADVYVEVARARSGAPLFDAWGPFAAAVRERAALLARPGGPAGAR